MKKGQTIYAVIGQREGEALPLFFRDADINSDVALWQLSQSVVCHYSVTLSSKSVKTLDHVLVLGFPGQDGLTPLPLDINNLNSQRGNYKVSANIPHGYDGGPLFNEDGHVVAVVERGLAAADDQNEIVPVVAVIDLLKRRGIRAGVDVPVPFDKDCRVQYLTVTQIEVIRTDVQTGQAESFNRQLAPLIEEMRQLRRTNDELHAKVDILSQYFDLNPLQLRTGLQALSQQNVRRDQVAKAFVGIATQYKSLQTVPAAQPNDDIEITALKTDARKAIQAGELARAGELEAQISVRQLAAQQHGAANMAVTSAERGEIALAQLEYATAATFFAEAAHLLPASAEYSQRRVDYLNREAMALYLQGTIYRDRAALISSIEKYRNSILELTKRETAPTEWAAAQNSLGNALLKLGERERDDGSVDAMTARLKEAVVAYHESLMERIRERQPLDWAATQNNLANALEILGEAQTGAAQLEQAADGYREVLKVWTREGWGAEWAAAQNNLATALVKLGRLEEAVIAYREALEERTLDRAPLDWARTMNSLGAALWALGERQGDNVRLETAVAAFQQVLRVYSVDNAPLDWARTMNNLGTALATLGQFEKSAPHLERAVAAYRDALTEETRDRVPLDWAGTQNNLGNSFALLGILGGADNAVRWLQDAVVAYHEALSVWSRQGEPLEWATAQNNLGNALVMLAERQIDTTPFKEAIIAYREALKEWTRAQAPRDWANTQRNLLGAFVRLGDRKRRLAQLDEALAAYREALNVAQIVAAGNFGDPISREDLQLTIFKIGSLAYRFIMAQNFDSALRVADEAISLSPDIIWLHVNRAHALMFLGRLDEARTIYLQRHGQKDVRGNLSWDGAILEDFSEMRKLGLTHPLMDEIKATFAK